VKEAIMTKSLFIIGAGPGIGAATAERFGRERTKILLGARDVDRLQALVTTLASKGIDAEGIRVDAVDPASVATAMRTADRRAEGLEAILYNAACVRQQDLFSMTDADIASDLAVNVEGAMYAIRAATRTFSERGGTILVTGGGFAVEPHPAYASLGVGKAAIRNLVHGISGELAERNIHIATVTVGTAIAPGSAEADGVAETFWQMAHDRSLGWEAAYPAQAV
jgi:NADP-dependent 3-hydroxy acid dehydrogenase YdfG